MAENNTLTAQQFLNNLKKFNVNINYRPDLCLFLFSSRVKEYVEQAHVTITNRPDIERELLESKGLTYHGVDPVDEQTQFIRNTYYRLAYIWETPDEELSDIDKCTRSYWLAVIDWLKQHGQDSGLPGAVRYVLTDSNFNPDFTHPDKTFPVLANFY